MGHVSRDEIVLAGPWFQGFNTPDGERFGLWDTGGLMAAITPGVALKGKTVLEVGCMHGVATAWLERMGAQVYPFDVHGAERKRFGIIKRLFDLAADFHAETVYRVTRCADVVVMCGVYYHLEHPMLGLETAWGRAAEVMLVEGEIMEGDETTALFVPAGMAYKGDGSNWWIPTLPCLMAWLEWMPGRKRIVDVTPDGYLPNRRLLQVWRA